MPATHPTPTVPPQARPGSPPPRPVGSAGALAPRAEAGPCHDSLAVDQTCAGCDERSVAFAAVLIACDGSQIDSACPTCQRLVRPFSWHGDNGQPSAYLLRFNNQARAVEVSAWYGSAGSIRSVPAVDPDRPSRHWWPSTFRTTTLARAILAHLIGLDVNADVWEAFEFDVILPLALGPSSDETLPVEEILDWLDQHKHLAKPAGPPSDGSEVGR